MIKVDKTFLDEDIVEEMRKRTAADNDFAYEMVGKLKWDLNNGVGTEKLDARKKLKQTVSDYRDTFVTWRLHSGERAWDSFLAEVDLAVSTRDVSAVKKYVNDEMLRMYRDIQEESLRGAHIIEDVNDFTFSYDRSARTLTIKVT